MAFDCTSLIEYVRVWLSLLGYDVYDLALLYEAARRENQTRDAVAGYSVEEYSL